MPTYEFQNTETGEVETHRMSYKDLDEFGENNPHLKKVISGGEMSRVMLAIKKILSEKSQLPTVIFDEIDSGVS